MYTQIITFIVHLACPLVWLNTVVEVEFTKSTVRFRLLAVCFYFMDTRAFCAVTIIQDARLKFIDVLLTCKAICQSCDISLYFLF